MAPVRGDGMRGLAVFISDIRNCKYTQTPFIFIYKLEDYFSFVHLNLLLFVSFSSTKYKLI